MLGPVLGARDLRDIRLGLEPQGAPIPQYSNLTTIYSRGSRLGWILSPKGHLTMSGDIFVSIVYHTGEGGDHWHLRGRGWRCY